MKLSPKHRKALRIVHLVSIGIWFALAFNAAVAALFLRESSATSPLTGTISIAGMLTVALVVLSGAIMIYAGGQSYLYQPWMIAKLVLIGFAVIVAIGFKFAPWWGPMVSAAVVLPIIVLTGWMSYHKPLSYLKETGRHTITGDPDEVRPHLLEGDHA